MSPSTTSIQDVLGAAVAELSHHPQPELPDLGLFDSEPEDFLAARATNSDHQVHRPVVDHALIANLRPDRVEEHNRVGRVQAALLEHASVAALTRSGEISLR